jgi:ATP-dependent protease ClpP protease subunit
MRSRRGAGNNRTCSGDSTRAWRGGRAGPAEEIAEDMRRGRYLDAQEALEYGLIDEVSGTK